MINLVATAFIASVVLIGLWFVGVLSPWAGYSVLATALAVTLIQAPKSNGADSWGWLILAPFIAMICIYAVLVPIPVWAGASWSLWGEIGYLFGSAAVGVGTVFGFAWLRQQ